MKKVAAKSQRASKEVSSVQPRAKRLMREALTYWRRYERVEKEQRRKAEKEAMEQRRRDDEMREVCNDWSIDYKGGLICEDDQAGWLAGWLYSLHVHTYNNRYLY